MAERRKTNRISNTRRRQIQQQEEERLAQQNAFRRDNRN